MERKAKLTREIKKFCIENGLLEMIDCLIKIAGFSQGDADFVISPGVTMHSLGEIPVGHIREGYGDPLLDGKCPALAKFSDPPYLNISLCL